MRFPAYGTCRVLCFEHNMNMYVNTLQEQPGTLYFQVLNSILNKSETPKIKRLYNKYYILYSLTSFCQWFGTLSIFATSRVYKFNDSAGFTWKNAIQNRRVLPLPITTIRTAYHYHHLQLSSFLIIKCISKTKRFEQCLKKLNILHHFFQ